MPAEQAAAIADFHRSTHQPTPTTHRLSLLSSTDGRHGMTARGYDKTRPASIAINQKSRLISLPCGLEDNFALVEDQDLQFDRSDSHTKTPD